MSDLPKYHLAAQQADALLAPVNTSLRELVSRLQHYLDRVTLEASDGEAVQKAQAVLAIASGEIARLLDESRLIAHG